MVLVVRDGRSHHQVEILENHLSQPPPVEGAQVVYEENLFAPSESQIAKAEQGDAVAQYLLGRMYYFGEGVPQDYKEAEKWFRKSAEQGYEYAQFDLGLMYYDSEAVPQDYKEAEKWFRKSAEQGNADAQYMMGFMYDDLSLIHI